MNLMHTMMFSCIKATELMEIKELVPLSLTKKIQLKTHVAMCSGCRNYMKQSKLINELLNKNFSPVAVTENTTELEASIINKL